MRDHHLHTPQKEHQIADRRTKSSSEQSKKPRKVAYKSLNAAYSPGSEDVSLELSKDSIDVSSIFEVSDDNQLYESTENFVNSSSPAVSPSVASAVSDLSMLSSTIASDLSPSTSMINSALSRLSSTITSDKSQAGDISANCGTTGLSIPMKRGIKAELVAKQFRQAGIQVSNSNDMVLLSKNILDALLKIVIEEFYDLPEVRYWSTEIVEKKVFLVLGKVFGVILTFMLLILVFAGVFFFTSGGQCSFSEPSPT